MLGVDGYLGVLVMVKSENGSQAATGGDQA